MSTAAEVADQSDSSSSSDVQEEEEAWGNAVRYMHIMPRYILGADEKGGDYATIYKLLLYSE